MVNKYWCSVCYESYPCASMRCLPCGHTYCSACITSITSRERRPPCPHCRESFTSAKVHAIFLESAPGQSQSSGSAPDACHDESVHRRVTAATEQVACMAKDARFQTIQRAAEEIGKVVRMMDDGDCMLNLLRAVAASWRGMLETFNAQRDHVARLNSEITRVKKEKVAAEALAKKAMLASEEVMPALNKTRGDLHEAQLALNKAHAELETVKVQASEEEERQKEEFRGELERKNKEIKGLHEHLLRLKDKESKQHRTIKQLREKQDRSQVEQMSSQMSSHMVGTQASVGLDVLPEIVEYADQILAAASSPARRAPTAPTKRKRVEVDSDEVASYLVGTDFAYTPSTSVKELPPGPSRQSARFSSDWNLTKEQMKQRRGLAPAAPRLPPVPLPFPLQLDKKGHTLKLVQTGSRRKSVL